MLPASVVWAKSLFFSKVFFGAVLLGFWLLFKGVFGMLWLRLFTFSILLRLGNLSVVLRLTVPVFAVLYAVKNRDDWENHWNSIASGTRKFSKSDG